MNEWMKNLYCYRQRVVKQKPLDKINPTLNTKQILEINPIRRRVHTRQSNSMKIVNFEKSYWTNLCNFKDRLILLFFEIEYCDKVIRFWILKNYSLCEIYVL